MVEPISDLVLTFDLPSVVRVAMLPGLREDRVLFTLPGQNRDSDSVPFHVGPHALRSADGDVVTGINSEFDMGNVTVEGVVWCPDFRTLAVSMRQMLPGDMPAFVTCAVDLRSGYALHTDSDGEWLALNHGNTISARGNTLLGCGVGRTTDEMRVCNSCSQFYPVEIADLRRPHTARSLLAARFDSKHVPEYELASCSVLAPDGRTIAFYSSGTHDATNTRKGIWTVDRHTRYYRRLTYDQDVRQIHWESPSSLLILKAGGSDETNCLVRLPLLDRGSRAGKPERLLGDVDSFQLLDG